MLFSVLIFNGCESRQASEARLVEEKAEEIKNQKDYLERFYRREAILLALKYRVDEEKVFKILVEEEDILYKDIDIEKLEDFIYGENLKKRIKYYSDKYNIPTDIIASILIDYEAMQNED